MHGPWYGARRLGTHRNFRVPICLASDHVLVRLRLQADQAPLRICLFLATDPMVAACNPAHFPAHKLNSISFMARCAAQCMVSDCVRMLGTVHLVYICMDARLPRVSTCTCNRARPLLLPNASRLCALHSAKQSFQLHSSTLTSASSHALHNTKAVPFSLSLIVLSTHSPRGFLAWHFLYRFWHRRVPQPSGVPGSPHLSPQTTRVSPFLPSSSASARL